MAFGVITVLAPLFFTALRIATPIEGQTEPQYLGYVGAFLVASALMLWAVLGQVMTVALLLAEIQAGLDTAMEAGGAPAFRVLCPPLGLMIVSGILLLRHWWRGTGWIVKCQSIGFTKGKALVGGPLPSWSVL